MGKEEKPSDLYMQYKDIRVKLSAADPRTLASQTEDTGLSIRGNLAWILHEVEVTFPPEQYALGAHSAIQAVLCTRKGLATMPELIDDGVVKLVRSVFSISGVGQSMHVFGEDKHILPPVPLATPSLTLYAAELLADHAGIEEKYVNCRIGFTTVPLTTKMYTEIAETWGW